MSSNKARMPQKSFSQLVAFMIPCDSKVAQHYPAALSLPFQCSTFFRLSGNSSFAADYSEPTERRRRPTAITGRTVQIRCLFLSLKLDAMPTTRTDGRDRTGPVV